MPRFFGRSAALPAKLTRRESEVSFASASASASASAHETLLQRSGTERGTDSAKGTAKGSGRRQLLRPASSQHTLQRAWLAAADARRPSWSGERPRARKLVKDPNGSARPSFTVALSDRDDWQRGRDTAAEGIRRTMARWREMRWGSGLGPGPGGPGQEADAAS